MMIKEPSVRFRVSIEWDKDWLVVMMIVVVADKEWELFEFECNVRNTFANILDKIRVDIREW